LIIADGRNEENSETGFETDLETNVETITVASFLHVMARMEICRELLDPTRSAGALSKAISHLRKLFAKSPQFSSAQNAVQISALIDAELVDKISSALIDMDALRWPVVVFEIA
jgi:hypothetical protein